MSNIIIIQETQKSVERLDLFSSSRHSLAKCPYLGEMNTFMNHNCTTLCSTLVGFSRNLPVALETLACSIFPAASPTTTSTTSSFPPSSWVWQSCVAGALPRKVANPEKQLIKVQVFVGVIPMTLLASAALLVAAVALAGAIGRVLSTTSLSPWAAISGLTT